MSDQDQIRRVDALKILTIHGGRQSYAYNEIYALTSTVTLSEPVTVTTVKPLVWAECGEAKTVLGTFFVEPGNDDEGGWAWGLGDDYLVTDIGLSCDAAKAAAQADYEARILSAVTATSAMDVRAEGYAAGWAAAVEAAADFIESAPSHWTRSRDARAIRAITAIADVSTSLNRMLREALAWGMREAAEIAKRRHEVCEDAFQKGLGPEERHCALEAKHIEDKILARAAEIEEGRA